MKPLPIGKSNFKQIIEEGCYYVDKTQVIEKLLSDGSEVLFFSRPRRFGKSLLMSMLDNFFNIEMRDENKELFRDLYISKSPYYSEISKYPTIYLNFKDLKSDRFDKVFEKFKMLISSVYNNKEYILEVLDDNERKKFNRIKNDEGTIEEYKESIKLLSIWLERYHKEKVIVLIDEYDAAINEGYILGYYEEIMGLIRPVLSSALKDNNSLKMGILTGVLRVGGESLFSSFNNVMVYDVMSKNYNEYFGFTKEETEELLNSYGLDINKNVDDYYDGYNFGGLHIYNPWSILNYAIEKRLEPYWMNTGSNKLIKDMLTKVSDTTKIESLIKGESIVFEYDKSLTYQTLTSPSNLNDLFNLLLVSGYLTLDREEIEDDEVINYFVIPNKEVKNDFIKIVQSIMFNEDADYIVNLREFKNGLLSGDKILVEKIINKLLLGISYYDVKEMFYHGYTLGLLSSFLSNKNYIVKSNREAGSGRYDLMVLRKDKSVGLLLEFKVSDNESKMEEKAEEGTMQMKEKEYYKELVLESVEEIKQYVVVFCGKKAIVR